MLQPRTNHPNSNPSFQIALTLDIYNSITIVISPHTGNKRNKKRTKRQLDYVVVIDCLRTCREPTNPMSLSTQ